MCEVHGKYNVVFCLIFLIIVMSSDELMTHICEDIVISEVFHISGDGLEACCLSLIIN